MGADNAGRLSRGQPNLDSPGEFVILARVKQRLALVALLALVAGAAWLLARRATGPQLVSGTVEVDVVRVASRTGGRVVALHAREGDTLRAGQLLAELDAPEVVARREEAAAHLAELEHGPRVEEIAAARAEWEALRAQLEFARQEAQRAEELFAAQTVSRTDLEQAGSRARALEQSVAAAAQRHALLAAGTRPEQVTQARARLAESEARVRELRVTAPATGAGWVLETWHVKVGGRGRAQSAAGDVGLDRPAVGARVCAGVVAGAAATGPDGARRTDRGGGD